jgi:hypothetical protein
VFFVVFVVFVVIVIAVGALASSFREPQTFELWSSR